MKSMLQKLRQKELSATQATTDRLLQGPEIKIQYLLAQLFLQTIHHHLYSCSRALCYLIGLSTNSIT